MTQTLRIGTRASALATAQAGGIARRLGDAELVEIISDGDRTTASLDTLGGTGVFASALREALLAGEVDVVVHSAKDLPTAKADGLRIAAFPTRADARDALISAGGLGLAALPMGARVGTGSPRRRAQLLAARADLDVVGIRGNVDSRMRRVLDPDDPSPLDAIVLAAAGLSRLGRLADVAEYLELGPWPTAPAQGALAVEVRESAPRELVARVAKLDHRPTRLAAEAERAVLELLEAGCAAPVGATAVLDDDLLLLSATVYALDGSTKLIASHAGYTADLADAPRELAVRVVDELLAKGAADLAPLGGRA
jgi:hydroxymethylbilane synthase